MSQPVLQVSALAGGYGRGMVLHGLDLTVEEGSVVVVLGPNGAGKTSMLRGLSGSLPQLKGQVTLLGRDVTRVPTPRRARLGLVHVPQGRGTFADLSVADNLAVGALGRRSRDGLDEDRDMVLEMFPVLADRRDQRAGLLSGGEQQMLAVGRAILARPRVLLLDEPSLGLSPLMVQRTYDALRQYRERTGVALVIVEQSAELALRLATDVRLLESGSFTFAGDPASVRADGVLAGAYLGRSNP